MASQKNPRTAFFKWKYSHYFSLPLPAPRTTIQVSLLYNHPIVSTLRMIQEEKENTSLRAEEIECRVGGDGLGGRFRSMSSLPPSHCGGSSVGGSPPGSGHSTPRRVPRSPNREMDRMGVMTLVRTLTLYISTLTYMIYTMTLVRTLTLLYNI